MTNTKTSRELRTAEKFFYDKDWGNKDWERGKPMEFKKSEMFDFADAYAQSLQEENERLREDVHDRQILLDACKS